MTEETHPLGTLTRHGDAYEGRIVRAFGHPPDRVWAMLTDQASLPQWLSRGSVEPRLGGKVSIDFVDSGIVIDSVVTAFEAGALLEYSWSSGDEPKRPLRWSLSSTGEGTRLELSVTVPAGEDPAKACAGFDAHLEMLAAALEGIPIKFPFMLYKTARQGYSDLLRS